MLQWVWDGDGLYQCPFVPPLDLWKSGAWGVRGEREKNEKGEGSGVGEAVGRAVFFVSNYFSHSFVGW